jgi:peptidoglycan/LPS O-acetylase OafA/YrhL
VKEVRDIQRSARVALPGHAAIQGFQSRPDFAANLDILRAFAVSLVLLGHTTDVVAYKHHLQGWGDFDACVGRLGVLLFFVHTSLVLSYSLARIRATGWELFRTFMVRRIFRLYPLSILCVLLTVIFAVPAFPTTPTAPPHSWGEIAANLTLTGDLFNYPVVLAPLWTLPVEMQMYAAMPVIFMMLGATRNPRVALALWLAAAVLAWTQPYFTRWLPVVDFGPCFMAGMIAYTLVGLYEKRLPSVLWMPFLLILLYGFMAIQPGVPETQANMPLQWVFCLVLGLVIPLFQDSRAGVVNYVAGRIARYSYGIYLFHSIALWVGCTALNHLPEPLQWAVALGLLGALSIGSYHLLEKPAIDFGLRITAPSAQLSQNPRSLALGPRP